VSYSLCLGSTMNNFRLIGLTWLALGALGLIVTIREVAAVGRSVVYDEGGLQWLAEDVLMALLTLTAAVAGYGLFRRWRWARIATEVVGSIVLVYSFTAFLFADRPTDWRMVAFVLSLFSLYSLIICLFVKYESQST
jgi:hypothetical protein